MSSSVSNRKHTAVDMTDDSSFPSSRTASTSSFYTFSEESAGTLPRSPDPIAGALPFKRSKVRRSLKLPFFSPYRRLAFTIGVVNVALLVIFAATNRVTSLGTLAYMVVANIFAAVLIRNQRIINFLFSVAITPRTRAPLWIRWSLGKVYHFGGIHSGCSVAATIWFWIFTVVATRARILGQRDISAATLVVTYEIVIILSVIVGLALPKMRARFHNTFEASHRFLGWTVLGLVWVHTGLLINDGRKGTGYSFLNAVVRSPTPYLLIVITMSIASTWVHLRKVPVTVTKPSNHAIIVNFQEGVSKPFAGSASTISLDPLTEWHSFANIPSPSNDGFRLVISRAGDWTSRVIDNPPSHFFIKGIATAGVARIETLFTRVLYVATGSGIGPCLPHLLAKNVPAHLFWSTRSPVDTYGDELVSEIRDAIPDAVIHDTFAKGKPDMVERAYALTKYFEAEAVICISNQKLTRKVVYGMESRGIPAFGAIWDS